MSPACLITICAIGSSPIGVFTQPFASLLQEPGPSNRLIAADSRDAVRTLYRQLMKETAPRKRPKPDLRAVVPRLAGLYGRVKNVKRVSFSEKSLMRAVIKDRLAKLGNRLHSENRVRRRELADARRRGRTSPDQLAGPAEIAAARQLINLIQSTIEPDSWDVNGGNGTIRFFPLLNVLVVRATGEVHYQIGGALGRLGR